MKLALTSKVVYLVIFIITVSAKTKEDDNAFTLGDPTYLGSGCPKGTVQTLRSSDGDVLSVLFSEYVARTSDDNKMSRVSCNLAIPIDVERGHSVGIFKIEYRGYTNIPADGGYSKFSTGIRGPKLEKTYEEDSEVYIDDEIGLMVYTDCGAKTILRVNTAIMAYKEDEDDPDVEIGIDSTDVEIDYEFRYYLKQVTC